MCVVRVSTCVYIEAPVVVREVTDGHLSVVDFLPSESTLYTLLTVCFCVL